MKAGNLLLVLAFVCLGVPGIKGQGIHVTKVAATEYLCAWLYSDGTLRAFIFNPVSGHPELTPYQIGGRKAIDASNGFNTVVILDDQGYVWNNDLGRSSCHMFATDETGAPFNNNIAVYGYFYTFLTIRSDGSIWYLGGDDYKYFGGSVGSPITQAKKLNAPPGVQFTKLALGNTILGLTSTGDVYSWSKGSTAYTKVNLPRPATDIVSSNSDFCVAVVPDDITQGTAGYPYAWGSQSPYWGGDGTLYLPSGPVALKGLWKMTYPIQRISASQNVIHYIDTQGDLYGIGDNPNGEIGNGEELVNHAEKYPTPYAWSWHKFEALTGAPPIHVAQGIKFKDIFTGPTYTFYHYALDVNDSLYFWGRDKSMVGGNGVWNYTEAVYPNALDVLTPSMRSPMSVTISQTLGYNFTPYTLKTTPKQTIIVPIATLSAIATPSILTSAGHPNFGYNIVSYKWTQVSGPPGATITLPNSLVTTVTGLTTGTYIFNVQTTDNNTGTISAADTIVVTSILPGTLVVDAGPDQTITLPTNSTTLTGSASEANGTITGYSWTQVSGPSTATIGTATQSQTTVSALVQGTYVFQLKATDALTNSATKQVKVTVNAASPGAITVNAGAGQTINLPTSAATLTGSASEVNGTIASYKWTQVSGPSTATIASDVNASTMVSGLVQGVYAFQLTATDALGNTGTAQTTVTVNAAQPGVVTADAGANQTITLPANSAILNGGASETGGTIVSTNWTQVSGPSTATLGNPRLLRTAVTGLVQGAYVFQLMATDAFGATGTAQVTITVNAAQPGVVTVNAGADQTITLPANSAALIGTASETGGTIASTNWTQVSGPSTATLGSPRLLSTSATGLVQGTYVFQLMATDALGAKGTAQVTITVNAAQPGVVTVNAGADQTINLPANSVALIGTASETGGTIASTIWTQVSGPSTATLGSPRLLSTSATGLVQGVYVFQLMATDALGAKGTAQVTITVNAAQPGVVTVNAGADQTINLPANSVALIGTASEVGGTIVSTNWTQVSGPSTATLGNPRQLSTSATGLVQGIYVFQLMATDAFGATGTSQTKVTVNATTPGDLPPVANAGPNQTVTGISVVSLDGSASYDPDGTIVKYQWIQISGAGGITITGMSTATPIAYGLKPGTYVFQLTVTDDKGLTGSAKVTITVSNSSGSSLVANAGPDQTVHFPIAVPVILDGSGSTDQNGIIVSYSWKQITGPSPAVFSNQGSVITTIDQLVAGDYIFELTVTDNSNNTASARVVIHVVSNERTKVYMRLYPNPIQNNQVAVEGSNSFTGPMVFRIYDMAGRTVWQVEANKQSTDFRQVLNVPGLGKGVYFLSIQFHGASKPETLRFVAD